MLALINQARSSAGLPAYTILGGLQISAGQHNLRMAGGCGLSHQCPGEPALGARETAAGVQWTAAGENIGEGGPVAATTVASTTVASTTVASTTVASTTVASTTVASTTVASTTGAITAMATALTRDMLAEKPPDDGHRLNLLSPDFTHIGIAVYRGSDGTVWLTQDFAN